MPLWFVLQFALAYATKLGFVFMRFLGSFDFAFLWIILVSFRCPLTSP